MADIVKLKKKAADFEAKKQLDKALEVYVEIVDAYEAGDEDTVDIPLYNRTGDMLQKAGRVGEAVAIWEKAVDRYAEGGFFNPAIALCNKILRQTPGRTVIYYKLGKIHAEKGFKGDARQNFLEYASRQQKAGNLDEAFRALKEFADLVPGQHDVRLMLADQLLKAERKDEAIDQLQLGYTQAKAAGDTDAADRIVEKLREVDPSIEPEEKDTGSSGGGGGLVFLDVDDHAPSRRPSAKLTPADVRRASKAVAGLELIDMGTEAPAAPAAAAKAPAPAPAPVAPVPAAPPALAAEELVVETTSLASDAPPPRGSLVGLEVTNLAEVVGEEAPSAASAPVADLPLMDLDAPSPVADLPLIEADSSLGLEPTAIGGAAPTDGIDLLEVEHSGAGDTLSDGSSAAADLPLLDASGPAADLPLLDASGPAADLPLLDAVEPTVEAPASDTPTPAADLPLLEASEPAADLPLLDAAAETVEIVEPDTVPSASVPSAEPAAPPVADLPLLDADTPAVIEVAVPSSAPVSVEALRAAVAANPEDWTAHRHLAEALLEQGARAEAMAAFETAMAGFEAAGDLDTAGSVADEIVRIDAAAIRSHQKRVEFAFRSNNRAKLAVAYLELADALLADGQAQKARAVYQRVLDITPDDLRAQAAIENIPADEPPAAPPPPRRSTIAQPKPAAPPPPAPVAAAPKDEEEYVSLGDWLREDDEPKSTRMVVEEQEPTGDEQADFSDMLRKFKQGVAENVDDEDHEAHYDLGVAYKEMGLVDEAIAEFQKALRGTENRARTFEALGNCFVEKGQLPVAATILQRALSEPGVRDESLVGVLYLLGAIAEEQKQFTDAKRYYERVFAVDIQFRDIGDRLNTVEQQLS